MNVILQWESCSRSLCYVILPRELYTAAAHVILLWELCSAATIPRGAFTRTNLISFVLLGSYVNIASAPPCNLMGYAKT